VPGVPGLPTNCSTNPQLATAPARVPCGRLYAHRASRRHRHHRDSHWSAPAGRAEGARGGAAADDAEPDAARRRDLQRVCLFLQSFRCVSLEHRRPAAAPVHPKNQSLEKIAADLDFNCVLYKLTQTGTPGVPAQWNFSFCAIRTASVELCTDKTCQVVTTV